MNPGTRVRLISDPGRVGTTTGKLRKRDGRVFWKITFSDGSQYISEKQLEIIQADIEDGLELLNLGKFGRARDLRGAITHIRLSGRLADLIYSMETTNTDFYPYQFKPVLNFLESPSGGILIADEVGLGKTIEAGLIWTELRSRYDTRRLMVLCPAMLREKWKLELQHRFGIKARIVDTGETLQAFRFVLVSTSVGQEGLDFHPYCHAIAHWNLPSNPVDMEQREGRIHRYKGHAVRKNISKIYANRLNGSHHPDPWAEMFEIARKEHWESSRGLIPFWSFPIEDGACIERHVPTLPLSRDVEKLQALKKSLVIYRMVFGQTRQEDMIEYLLSKIADADVRDISKQLQIYLGPPIYIPQL